MFLPRGFPVIHRQLMPFSMCEVDVTSITYSCGDTAKYHTNFSRCPDAGTPKCPGAKEKSLGSSRKAGKCGKAGCRDLTTAGS